MRLGIVNDLNLAVEALRRVVSAEPELQVAWTAVNGEEAVRMCRQDPPDMVLMDLVMPVMDGVEATRRIMSHQPLPILIVTATIEGHGDMVYEALGHGALDAAVTPTLGLRGEVEGGRVLLDKIAEVALAADLQPSRRATLAPLVMPDANISEAESHCPLVAIGASTGGPNALVELLAALPADFPAAVAIVQHLDAHFMEGLKDWLATRTQLPIHLGTHGVNPHPGQIYLAARNAHWTAEPKGHFIYSNQPEDTVHRPSIDVFFSSLAASWQKPGIALLLTGMGSDGAAGLLQLKRAGWTTCAQDEASCVVYGMPKAAVRLQAASRTEDIPGMARMLLAHDWQKA